MDTLKTIIIITPTLRSLDYTDTTGEIILTVDVSLKGWGRVL